MPYSRFFAIALASTSLAAVPAQAGGPLGAAGGCLCNAVSGLLGGGAPSGPAAGGLGNSVTGAVSRASGSGLGRHGSISGNVTSGIDGTLGVTTSRSIDRRNGRAGANVGLAGTVSNVSNATIGAHGMSKSIGLAGRVNAAANTALSVTAPRTHSGHGGGAPTGRLINVSALNATGAADRSLANVSALNATGGTSGRIANVSVLNGTGTTGRSLANVAVLNGSTGGTGRVANVSVLNGHRGHGAGNDAGGLNLPDGVQLINGIPCGPDGKPLTGSAAATVMAMITTTGGGGSHHGSGSPGGSSNSGGSNGSTGATSGSGSQGSSSASGGGHSRDRDTADRKDLWWPPHPEQQSDSGRLNDH